MTDLLQHAIDEAPGLPDREQDRIAAWRTEELRSEGDWDRRSAGSRPQLERLAKEAIHRRRACDAE